MTPLLFSLDAGHPLFAPLCRGLNAEPGQLAQRRFPDGESYLRIGNEVGGRPAVVLAQLSRPDDKFLPLCFLCDTLRELGASQVGLVAPYLCYMRQDSRFQPGEAVTSRTFARLLSGQVDWLVTVDPHLHRYHSLNEIYQIPSKVIQAAPLLATWLHGWHEPVLLVGPDAESEQWVAQLAAESGHDYVVGEKQRRGDREVQISLPELTAWHGHSAVIIDDVISSGQTVLQALSALRARGLQRVDCVAIHGLFADRIEHQLAEHGLRRLITTNAIAHPSNTIDLSPLLLSPIKQFLDGYSVKIR